MFCTNGYLFFACFSNLSALLCCLLRDWCVFRYQLHHKIIDHLTESIFLIYYFEKINSSVWSRKSYCFSIRSYCCNIFQSFCSLCYISICLFYKHSNIFGFGRIFLTILNYIYTIAKYMQNNVFNNKSVSRNPLFKDYNLSVLTQLSFIHLF